MHALLDPKMAGIVDGRTVSAFTPDISPAAHGDFGEALSRRQLLHQYGNNPGSAARNARAARKDSEVKMVKNIKTGEVVKTGRGISKARSATICYLPALFDIHYGDGKPGCCFLSDTKCPGWDRCRLGECNVVL